MVAAGADFSFDGAASEAVEAFPAEFEAYVFGVDPIEFEFGEEGRVCAGFVIAAWGFGLDVIVVSADASFVCHSSICLINLSSNRKEEHPGEDRYLILPIFFK